MKSERGAVKGYGSWEVIVVPGPLEHRCRHLVGTKGSSSACGNNRELCKENHIENRSCHHYSKERILYSDDKERTSGYRYFVGAGREAPWALYLDRLAQVRGLHQPVS